MSFNNCECCSFSHLFCSIVRTKSTNYFNNISNICIFCCIVNKNRFSFFVLDIEVIIVSLIVACYCTCKFYFYTIFRFKSTSNCGDYFFYRFFCATYGALAINVVVFACCWNFLLCYKDFSTYGTLFTFG